MALAPQIPKQDPLLPPTLVVGPYTTEVFSAPFNGVLDFTGVFNVSGVVQGVASQDVSLSTSGSEAIQAVFGDRRVLDSIWDRSSIRLLSN